MRCNLSTVLTVVGFVSAFTALTLAQTGGGFALIWSTMDGGGGTSFEKGKSGELFVIRGTIGQHDAGPEPTMTGGGFGLTGGFWPVTFVCPCLADMNSDGKKNGADVQKFVQCLIAGQGVCVCADVNAAGGVSVADVPVFVNTLLTQSACP